MRSTMVSCDGQRTDPDVHVPADDLEHPPLHGPSKRRILTVTADLPFILQVALVRHDDDGEVILVLYAQDLLVKREDLIEAVTRGDAVYQKEALPRPHVLFPHGRVLLLSGCVQDIEQCHLFVNHTLFAVRVLNRRVVFVDKVTGKGLASVITTPCPSQLSLRLTFV